MDQEPKTIANSGYRVEPAKNGGFIAFSSADPMYKGDQYAFSNSNDLIQFLTQEHDKQLQYNGDD